ncbi:hypothetical protein SEA_ANNADREAMY_249 [Streptomyces phage Annadreamy]|uniref:Lipoprotein n=2 Tax=Annadreamyvirus annadreamy TaxID=2846392 RepID=A0A345GTQ6_9CAUD|nr:hypothetical protein HWB75_gp030 [Streptomyces phage Annadreamy]AXG66328.1 hypothetical protein SEA_ANNADREAMY_249 [Streptomyces phage Annadreamy]QGH79556.1 hypothetical protein SEA_LIMPID_255 [Streptomyces phage Limpid]
MKRIAALTASVVAGSVLLTGCGDLGGKPVNPPAKGMVYEREESLDSTGHKVYELSLTTDRKAIRRKASRSGNSSKKKDITVSEKVYKNCGLTEMYPACK